MGNYLDMVERQRVLALLELGWSYRKVAKETGVHRETVARYASRPESKPANLPTGSEPKPATPPNLPTGSPPPPPGRSPGPVSAAEPYRDQIEKAVGKGVTAQRIWQDLRDDEGFAHGYDSVKRLVRGVKRQRPEVADVMEHPPGEEGQVDYFKGPPTLDTRTGRWGRPWIFRLTMSCSRHGYEEPIWGQDQHRFIRAHEHGFHAMGGVPTVIRHDNLKAAVVRACLYDPDVSVLYAAFAKHWGFTPLPSRPRHPEENGVAERSGGYVKDNALKGRRFDSLDELGAFLVRWNRTIAQLRIHGTTRQQVIAHFLAVDQPALQPLAETPFPLFEVGTRSVHNDGHVEVQGTFYSVPHALVGQRVRVHWDDHLVRVYVGGEAVAVHSRRESVGFSTRPEHRPAHKPGRQEGYEKMLLAKAEHIGPQVLAWAKEAVKVRDVRAYRLLQGVVGLTRSHPRERVDWACGVALERGSFRYQTLRRLVDDAAVEPAAPPLIQEHELIRELSLYGQLVT